MEIDITNGAAVPTGGALDRSSFADAALDDILSDSDLSGIIGEGPPAEAPRARARSRTEREPQPERNRRGAERDDEGAEAQDAEAVEPAVDGEGDADGDPESDTEQERAPEVEHARGSREEPFSVKDLPADKYIELTVDGQKHTVSLAELGKGYIREETFHQRVGKVQEQAKEAIDGVQKAREIRERTRESLRTVLEDPEELYAFFMGTEDREKVLEQVAMKYALLRRQHREQPEEKLKFQRARDVARLEAERARWQAEKDAERQAAEQKVQAERAEKTFRPGWEEGLRKAGFPEPTQGLFDEVMVRIDQRMRSGHPINPEDVAEFTYRSCKLLDLQPRRAGRRPAPAPIPAGPSREEAPRRRSGKGRSAYEGMTQRERIRDPEYFLQGISRRELGY